MPREKTYRQRQKPHPASRASNDWGRYRCMTPLHTENDIRTRPPPPAHLTGPRRPAREAARHAGRRMILDLGQLPQHELERHQRVMAGRVAGRVDDARLLDLAAAQLGWHSRLAFLERMRRIELDDCTPWAAPQRAVVS